MMRHMITKKQGWIPHIRSLQGKNKISSRLSPDMVMLVAAGSTFIGPLRMWLNPKELIGLELGTGIGMTKSLVT